MKKKVMVLSLCGLCAAMGIGAAAAIGGLAKGGLVVNAVQHDAAHTLKEKAYEAPQVGQEGFKPYYLCQECCAGGPAGARYSYADKSVNVALSDIRMPGLVAATEADIAEGDQIGTINKGKFKYVDQGVNGVDGKEGTSTPLYVKDGDKTALFFSRSGKTGAAYNATDNTDCSEFRFSPSGHAKISSVTFSYRYLDYGTGVWAGGGSASEPEGWHSMIQYKDGTYYGKAVEFLNDDAWHTITINYADYESAGNKEYTTSFSDLIIKFVDLRGHFYISGLSFADTNEVTLKNVNAEGTDVVETLVAGQMPKTVPSIEGKTFIGWYDEQGNKVTSVTGSMTLIARYKQEVSGVLGDTIYTFNTTDESLYSKPEDCTNFWSMRHQANFGSDETNKFYQRPDAGSFVGYNANSASTDTVGVTLPAFDFSAHGALTFTFGANAGHDGNEAGFNSPFLIDGNAVGYDCDTSVNYTATLRGQTMNVYNKRMSKTFTFTLSDDVYTGKKGLTISTTNDPYRWLLVSSYKELAVDYFAKAKAIEAALPETPTEANLTEYNTYLALRAVFTAYETTAYPVSTKMKAWADAMPKTVFTFDNNGGECQMSGLSQGADAASTAGSLGKNTVFDLGEGYCIALTNDQTAGKYGSITLPVFDFSSYTSVVFTFGQGGNGGGTSCRYYLGSVDSSTSYEDSLNLPNYLGEATSTDTNAWNLASDIKATVADGKITFKGTLSKIDKTIELDEEIYKGQKGLTLTLANVCWEFFVISPFTGSNLA